MDVRFSNDIDIDSLLANHTMVSVNKYGFFLCLKGSACVLLGGRRYEVKENFLCFYTPNTFFQILERSDDLSGIIEEDTVDVYYPAVSLVDVRTRLQVRNFPCIAISPEESDEIIQLINILRSYNENKNAVPLNGHLKQAISNMRLHCLEYFRYAFSLKILEIYFTNAPVAAMSESKEEEILNGFLVSVYEKCREHRTVKYYAELRNLSPYYFSTIIKKQSGKSAMEWIDDITMRYIRQYLDGTDKSIKEISDCMNFPDQSTFGRYFKHHEGCTPSEYRNRPH